MQVKTLTCQGKATAGLPATASGDLVRFAEFVVALSGTAPRVHQHTSADITDLATALGTALMAAVENSDTVRWLVGGGQVQAVVALKANGGVLEDAQGLFIDSGVVSVPGHGHQSTDISDWQTALTASIGGMLQNGPSVNWLASGTGFSAVVQVVNNGGLVLTAGGLQVNLGTGHTQAAYGDHTHALLHPAVTTQPSTSLTLLIDGGQVLSAEVALEANGGLILNSGVGTDFGVGHNQVARGDHTHTGYQGALVVANTPSLTIGLDVNNMLSGTVRTDPSPGPNCGALGVGTNGMYVQLGSGSRMAAGGDHTHTAATESADGFFSAADKTRLDTLVAGAGGQPYADGQLIVLDGAGVPIPTGLYEYIVMPYSGTITGWDLIGLPSGTLAVDVYQGTFSGLPLTVSNSITGANKPTLSGVAIPARAQNLAVSWAFSTGDVLGFNVDSCAGVKRATLGLRIRRS